MNPLGVRTITSRLLATQRTTLSRPLLSSLAHARQPLSGSSACSKGRLNLARHFTSSEARQVRYERFGSENQGEGGKGGSLPRGVVYEGVQHNWRRYALGGGIVIGTGYYLYQ